MPSSAATPGRFGHLRLSPGVTRRNLLTFFYASFFSVSLVTVLNFLQAYILTEQLAIPRAQQGTLSGDLGFLNEIVALMLIAPIGVWSDKVGRRFILVSAMCILGLSYFLLPTVTSTAGLYAFRVLHSVGAAAGTGMIGIIAADYALAQSRGKLVAYSSMLIGLGVVLVVRVAGQIPVAAVGEGMTSLQGGQLLSISVGLVCLISALVLWQGLRPGRPVAESDDRPAMELLREGLRAARDPRILLAYAAAFVSRADQAIIGLFLSLWALQVGQLMGLDSAAALSRSTTPFVTAAMAGLVWAPFLGIILDRVSSIMGVAIALGLGSCGYLLVSLVENPLATAALPAFALLGIGQVSTLIGAQTLIGKIAPDATRGSIIGVFGFCGAVGMMLTSVIGGRLFDNYGPTTPFVAVGIVQAILFLTAIVLARRGA